MAEPELSLSERVKQRMNQIQSDGGSAAKIPSEPTAPLSQRVQERTQNLMGENFPEARVLTPPPAGQQRDLSGTEVLSKAIQNAPRSAYEAGAAFVQPFMNPVETYETMKGLGKGLYSKAEGVFVDQDPRKKAQDEAIANAVGEFYKNRYGSIRGVKEAVAEDPFGVLLDASSVMSGAGILGRAPGFVGKAGRIAQKVGEATDPMRVIPKGLGAAKDLVYKTPGVGPYIESGVQLAKEAPAKFYEYRTGVAPGTMSTAYEAGKTASPDLMPFVEQMRKQAPRTELVDMINQSVNTLEQQQKQNFLAGRAGALANQTPVSVQPIEDAITNAYSSIRHGGIPGQMDSAEQALSRVSGLLQAYQNQPVPLNKLEDLDALKRAVDNLYGRFGGDTQANRVLTEVKQAIKQTIGAKSPDYLKIMDEAETARGDLEALRYAIGTEGRVPERQLRKIATSMKDQDKLAIIDRLAQSDPKIAAAIRGMSASELKMPSTIEMLMSYGLGFVASGHPGGAALAAADVASKSPRILGELSYGTGRGVKVAKDIANSRVGRPIIETGKTASPFIQELGKYQERKDREKKKKEFVKPLQVTVPVGIQPPRAAGGRVARASGGRIEILRGVRALMQAAENAKKSISKSTETLLEQPDENIAQALHVAKKNI